MSRIKILNVEVDNITQEGLLYQLNHGVLVTPNVDDIMKHQRDELFHKNASLADYVVCDSKIVLLASRILGTPLKEAIPGSSFFPRFCDYHKNDDTRLFLLGAKEGVGEEAKRRINERVGRKIVVETYSPPFGFEKDEKECQHILSILKSTSANVVLVGLGNPKQTNWIFKYKDQLPNIDVFMALGATIDFEAGNIKRAPKIFQKLAMEWFYRFLKEPKRMYRRYFIEDIPFFWYLGKQLLGLYKDPFEPKEQGNRG